MNDDVTPLDQVERGLYDPKNKVAEPYHHSSVGKPVSSGSSTWGETTRVITPSSHGDASSFAQWFLVFSVCALLAALLFMGWRVMSSRNVVQGASIDIAADITPYVEGGETVPLAVTVQNRNSGSLVAATITVSYQKGVGENDEEERVTLKKEIGDIAENEFKRETFDVVLFGKESDSRDISIKVDYKVRGSNAVFTKTSLASVVLKTPPLSISIKGPETLSSGQLGVFIVTVKNNTSTTTTNNSVKVTFPNSFVLTEVSPALTGRDMVWGIEKLLPGESDTFTVSGTFSASSGERLAVRGVVGSKGGSFNDIGIVYSSEVYDLTIRTSPLRVTVTGETERGSTNSVRYGDRMIFSISYENIGSELLSNVSLTTAFAGNAGVLSGITLPDGYYNSETQEVIIDKATNRELSSVRPGDKGTFRIFVPLVEKGTNSPTITVTTTGEATRATVKDVVTQASKKWVVEGSAALSGYTIYKNSMLGSTGPMPPQVNMTTAYTAHIVASAQNELIGTKVVFTLPAYVSWGNKTSDSSRVAYDSRTRTVTWTIGGIASGGSATVDVLLLVKPSQTHIDQAPAITSGLTLEATEADSRARLRVGSSALTTAIFGEAWGGVDVARVIP